MNLGENLNLESEFKLNRYYYTVDEQGSTVFITDKNQQVKNEYYYDAFGNVLESKEQVHNRITYTGQQYDSLTQQYYLRARFYNPVIGRFTQEDIYRGDGLNLYAYCGNNPIQYYDPSGYNSTINIPGNADFIGPIPAGSWKLSPTGAGAHLVEKVNVKGRKNLVNYNKRKTPRYYPYGTPENAGQAHLRLHEATKKAGIRLQGGNPDLSDKQLIKKYKEAYADSALDGIRGDLRTPNSKTIIATNVTPKEAMEELQKWEIKERKKTENKSTNTCKCKSK